MSNDLPKLNPETGSADVYRQLKEKELKSLDKLIVSNRLLSVVTLIFVVITGLAVRQAKLANQIALEAVAETRNTTDATKELAEATKVLSDATYATVEQARDTHETTKVVLGEIERIGRTFQYMEYQAPKIVRVSDSESGLEDINEGHLLLSELQSKSFIWVHIKNEGSLPYTVQPELYFRTTLIGRIMEPQLIPMKNTSSMAIRLDTTRISRILDDDGQDGQTKWKYEPTLKTD